MIYLTALFTQLLNLVQCVELRCSGQVLRT